MPGKDDGSDNDDKDEPHRAEEEAELLQAERQMANPPPRDVTAIMEDDNIATMINKDDASSSNEHIAMTKSLRPRRRP